MLSKKKKKENRKDQAERERERSDQIFNLLVARCFIFASQLVPLYTASHPEVMSFITKSVASQLLPVYTASHSRSNVFQAKSVASQLLSVYTASHSRSNVFQAKSVASQLLPVYTASHPEVISFITKSVGVSNVEYSARKDFRSRIQATEFVCLFVCFSPEMTNIHLSRDTTKSVSELYGQRLYI
jgi:hypothetical protein